MLLSSWRHGRASSDDQENRALGTGNEALEKFDEDGSIDAAVLLDHEPHPASREGRPDQAQPRRVARSTRDLLNTLAQIAERKAGFRRLAGTGRNNQLAR